MLRILSIIEMILSVAIIGIFIMLMQQTQTAKLTRAMEATSKSLQEAAKVSLMAKDYYGNMSGSLQKSGEAMRDLAPTVKALGDKTQAAGAFLKDMQMPSGIKLEGFRPVLEYARPFSTNTLVEIGNSFQKVGESLETSGPQLIEMAEDAPRISASLQIVHDQLLVASSELAIPVQGHVTLFHVGIAAGLLLLLQSISLFVISMRLK